MTQTAGQRAGFATERPFPYVLMYHSVAAYDHDPYLITVDPVRFERQLRWLRRRGLTGVSMRELLEARRVGRDRGLVGLTFDDGYTDFATTVLPALQRFGFTATVFVIAGRMGGHNDWDPDGPRKSLMSPEQVREVAEHGFEIGSHGLLHRPLPDLDGTAVSDEVIRSRAMLRDISGQDVGGFCYPYGAASQRVVSAVAENYDYGCAIWRAPYSGRFALPRTYIGDRDGAVRLIAKHIRHALTARG